MNGLIAEINALGHEISAAELDGDDDLVIRLCREKIALHRRLLWRRRMIRALTFAQRFTHSPRLARALLRLAGRIGNPKRKQERKTKMDILTSTNTDKITFEFTTTNVYTRWPCHICGGHTEKVSILCEVLAGEHEGLRICESCLEAGKDKVNARLESHIAQLERRAAYKRSLVGRLEFPSYRDWEKAGQKYEHEWEEAERRATPREQDEITAMAMTACGDVVFERKGDAEQYERETQGNYPDDTKAGPKPDVQERDGGVFVRADDPEFERKEREAGEAREARRGIVREKRADATLNPPCQTFVRNIEGGGYATILIIPESWTPKERLQAIEYYEDNGWPQPPKAAVPDEKDEPKPTPKPDGGRVRLEAFSHKRTRGELLEHYCRCEPTPFFQYDGFTALGGGDCVMRPDKDDDCLTCQTTWELMSGCCAVRVLIRTDAKPTEVCRVLDKIKNWIMRSGLPSPHGDDIPLPEDSIPF